MIAELAAQFSSPKIDRLVDVMRSPDVRCQPRTQWQEVPVQLASEAAADADAEPLLRDSTGAVVPMRVALLGEASRRQQEEKVVLLDAPARLPTALLEPEAVTSF